MPGNRAVPTLAGRAPRPSSRRRGRGASHTRPALVTPAGRAVLVTDRSAYVVPAAAGDQDGADPTTRSVRAGPCLRPAQPVTSGAATRMSAPVPPRRTSSPAPPRSRSSPACPRTGRRRRPRRTTVVAAAGADQVVAAQRASTTVVAAAGHDHVAPVGPDQDVAVRATDDGRRLALAEASGSGSVAASRSSPSTSGSWSLERNGVGGVERPGRRRTGRRRTRPR